MTGANLDAKVMWAIARAAALIAKHKRSESGMSGESIVLSYLYACENNKEIKDSACSINQSKIANASGITPQSVGALISNLESKGFIERIPSETDRRSMQVVLTDAGRAEAAKIRKEQARFSKETLSCFDDAEKKQLLMLLNKLSDFVSDADK